MLRMIFVGAACGGPPDILCYCKDCQRQPLQKQIFVGEPALGLPQIPSHLNGTPRAAFPTYCGHHKHLWWSDEGAHCAPLQKAAST